jgi:Bacterial Ig-like domain (group 3)/FG-GAP-like repeat
MAVPLKLRLSIFAFVALMCAAVSAQTHRGSLGDSAHLSGTTPQSDSAGTHGPSAIIPRKSGMTSRLASAGPSGLNFAAAVSYASGGHGGNSIAVGDLNGDGNPDLVVADWCETSACTNGGVAVLLGNGDGTFQTPVPYGSGGLFADSVAIADLRGNGKLDLIVGNCGSVQNNICIGTSGGVGVLLGKGDGTFNTAVSYSATLGGAAVAAADVNADGKIDLLLATNCGSGSPVVYIGCLGVLLGNGDGTFAAAVTYNSGGYSPTAIAIGDMDGDGKPDVVVSHCGTLTDAACGTGNVGVMLGNGDGTFVASLVFDSAGIYPDGVAIADFNGDGKPDVVVVNSSISLSDLSGNVGVLLGNGEGTLQTAVAYGSGGFGGSSVALMDVDGDSKFDIVVANCSNSAGNCTGTSGSIGVGVLLGNGDGTFQSVVTYAAGGNTPFGIAVADLNGDSKPDIVTANCGGSVCGASPGSVGVLLNASLGGTTTNLISSLNPAQFGQAVTFTATVTSGFTGTPTGSVDFFSGTTNIGTSALNSSAIATLTTSTLAAGSDSITATYGGDTNFVTSTSSALSQVVQGVSTTSLTVAPSVATLGASVTLTAIVSSTAGTPANGETVTFTDATTNTTLGSAALASGAATFTSTTIPVGTYSVVANYPGDASTLASVSSAQPLQVQPGSSTTTLTVAHATVAFGASVTLTAKVTSTAGTPADGETVTFMDSSTNTTLGTGALASGTATFTSTTIKAGTYSVVASYPGDANIPKSASAAQTLNVQNFTLSGPSSAVIISAPGQSGTATITIAAFGGLSASSVGGWSCSGLPSLSSCAFGTVNSSNQVAVTISTTASSDLRWPALGRRQELLYALWLPGFLGVVTMAGHRRRSRALRMLALVSVLSLTTLWLACGGSSTTSIKGTPPESGTVTVNASSGTLKGSTTFTLTVN